MSTISSVSASRHSLELVISDLTDISRLVGNCGRKARRGLESLLVRGALRIPLVFTGTTQLQFAYLVRRVKTGCDMAQACLDEDGIQETVSMVDFDMAERKLTVKMSADMPSPEVGVRALLRWASSLAYSLARVQAMLVMSMVPATDREMLDSLCLTAWRSETRLANMFTGNGTVLSAEQEAEIEEELDHIEGLVQRVFAGDPAALTGLVIERPYLQLGKILAEAVPAAKSDWAFLHEYPCVELNEKSKEVDLV